MKLTEAVEIVEYILKAETVFHTVKHYKALLLLLKAGELVESLRFDGSPYYPNLLEGETPE